MIPSLDSLRCFVEAAERLNFRQAAAAVHLSPAALGQRIRHLEEEARTPLFERTTRRVALTPRGLALLPLAKEAIAAARRCVELTLDEPMRYAGEITIGTRHELGMSWLVPLLLSLEKVQPEMTPHLYFGAGDHLVAKVRERALDCAVTSSRLSDPVLDFFQICREEYLFVATPQLLRNQPLQKPRDAAAHTLFDTTRDLALFRYWRGAAGGVDVLAFKKVVQLGTIDAIREFVVRGKGVAVLPRYFVAADLARKRLTVVMPKVKPHHDFFRLVFRADDPKRPLYDWLSKQMQKYPLK